MATLIEKRNIEKAKELLDQKDFIPALEILNGLIKTRRFNDHKEVQVLMARAKKLSLLSVPVFIVEPEGRAVVNKGEAAKGADLPPWHKRVWDGVFKR
ncbi:MAG TPA: hypothetical protein EYN05_04255 [Nitrospinaceae bacterium]|nr:hypothetical protein [Nitrospinaceae bacterium]